MTKARKRFMLYAMLAIAVSLVLLLGLINGALLTMAAEDADRLTWVIAENGGVMKGGKDRSGLRFENGRPVNGMLGPNSPDMQASLRYFTCALTDGQDAELIVYNLGTVSREEAIDWAVSLSAERDVGWTAGSYRYRIWTADQKTYITVIDQGRELIAFYRILRISVIGLVLTLACSFMILLITGKRLFKPLETAEYDRNKLMTEIDRGFSQPLTVMNAGIENLERRNGSCEESQLIRRQLTKMTAVIRGLPGTLDGIDSQGISLKEVLTACETASRPAFDDKGIRLMVSAEDGLELYSDRETITAVVQEMFDNAFKFAKTYAEMIASQQGGRITLEMNNDTALPDGVYDQVFDRLIRLDNAEGIPGSGIGLHRVRELVRMLNGRVKASVSDGVFTIRVNL